MTRAYAHPHILRKNEVDVNANSFYEHVEAFFGCLSLFFCLSRALCVRVLRLLFFILFWPLRITWTFGNTILVFCRKRDSSTRWRFFLFKYLIQSLNSTPTPYLEFLPITPAVSCGSNFPSARDHGSSTPAYSPGTCIPRLERDESARGGLVLSMRFIIDK